MPRLPLPRLFAAALLLLTASPLSSAPETTPFAVTRLSDAAVDPAALTIDGVYGPAINGLSFQQDALVSFQGWQYLAYYDASRRVCLARRLLPEGPWEVVRFADYVFKGDDAHNVIAIGIAPADGTIHLAFDHHGHPLHYRVSQKEAATRPEATQWTPRLFGPVTDRLQSPTRNVTYPQFLTTPQGNLQFFYRFGTSGAGDWWMADYDAATGAWSDTRRIDSGDGVFQDRFNTSQRRNAYPNGFDYGADGRLHYTWTWRENTQGANHDIGYAYSDDQGRVWRNNLGVVVNPGDRSRFINLKSPGVVVVPLDRGRSLMNQQAQAVDSRGRIHVAMWHRPEGAPSGGGTWAPQTSRYHHYWRDDEGRWQSRIIPSEVGNRPKLFFDADDNAYLLYTVNRKRGQWIGSIYYLDGELQVAAASAASGWTDWSVIHRETNGSYLNEILGDSSRLLKDGILSVLAQDTPARPRAATALRVIDLRLAGPRIIPPPAPEPVALPRPPAEAVGPTAPAAPRRPGSPASRK